MLQIFHDDMFRHDSLEPTATVKYIELLQSAPCWLVYNRHLCNSCQMSSILSVFNNFWMFLCIWVSFFRSENILQTFMLSFFFYSLFCLEYFLGDAVKPECACSFILQFFSLLPPSLLCFCPCFLLLFLQLFSSVILSMISSCWLPVTWRQAGCVVRVERCDFKHLMIYQIGRIWTKTKKQSQSSSAYYLKIHITLPHWRRH